MKYNTILLALLFCFYHSFAQQNSVYLHFNDPKFVDFTPDPYPYPYLFVNIGTSDCKKYKWEIPPNLPLTFPNSFSFQITDTDVNDTDAPKIENITLNGEDVLKLSVNGDDSNCGGSPESRRSEIVFLDLPSEGVGWYKLRFYLADDFKIDRGNGNTSPDYSDHHIFQAIINQQVDSLSIVTPLPQFLIDFEHELSNDTIPKLSFAYGLEFRYRDPYEACMIGPMNGEGCYNTILGANGVADLNCAVIEHCVPTRQQKVLEYDAAYGWNELLFKINWSDGSDGYMDIYLNDIMVTQGDYDSNHTFEGPNVYNEIMFPLTTSELPDSHRYDNAFKFGHYRYLYSNPTGSQVQGESDISFDYFLADYTDDNISSDFSVNDFHTQVTASNNIIDFHDNIDCDEVRGADNYIFLIRDVATGGDFYVGSQSNELDVIHLLNSQEPTDFLEFNKDYEIAVRTNFIKGFNSKYDDPVTVQFVPNTKLNNSCPDSISKNGSLSNEVVLGADGYVYYIYDAVDQVGYYSGVGAGAQINISTLMGQHGLVCDREYLINVRAKFDYYGLQGSYSTACAVTFTGCRGIGGKRISNDVEIYPNPIDNVVYISSLNRKNSIEIFNFEGQSVYESTNLMEGKLNLSFLRKGIYILKVKSNDKINVFQIVKN
jgi:hypothetical protein